MEQKSLRRRFAALLLMLCLLAAGALPALATSANIRLVDASGNPATGTIRVALYDSAKDKALSGGQLTLYRVAEVKRKNGDLSLNTAAILRLRHRAGRPDRQHAGRPAAGIYAAGRTRHHKNR